MEKLAFLLPMFGCGLMMVICMALMGRARHGGDAERDRAEDTQ